MSGETSGKHRPSMNRPLALDEAAYGKQHPEVAKDLSNLAAVHYASRALRSGKAPL